MKAVNLIPAEAAQGGSQSPRDVQAVVYGLLGLLGAGVLLMALYVLAGNSISQRRVQLTALKADTEQTQSQVGQLASYVQFQQLAATRAVTVRQIATSRFDWAGALAQLARVVPANTTLQTLNASTSGSTGSGAAPAAAAAGAPSSPSFDLKGCTGGQVDVARLMSRLRLVSGVERVALNSSQKSAPTAGGAAGSTAPPAGGASGGGCGTGSAEFEILVYFAAPTAQTGSATAVGASG